MAQETVILAVDPGREKCGVAVLSAVRVLDHRVIPTSGLVPFVGDVLGERAVAWAVVGDQTSSGEVRKLLEAHFPSLAVVTIGEERTTLEARRLYFKDHLPRGWRRLLPLSLQVPPVPHDDYAAIVLGQRFLATRAGRP
jgi:hypothetical protein